MILWYISVTLYLILWAALLLHCIRRRVFYPVFGTAWGTKILWLITFAFFSPPLTIMYIIFGVVIKPRNYHAELKPIRPVSVIVVLLLAVIIVTLEIPSWNDNAKPKVFTKGIGDSSNGFKTELSAAKFEANNNFSTVTSSSHSSFARFAARTIVLKITGTDALLTRTAEILAKSLSEIAYVDKVEYFPHATYQPSKTRAPDVMIDLSMLNKQESKTPFGSTLDTVFLMQAANSPHRGISSVIDTYTPPPIQFTMRSTLDHKSTLKGYESRQAKYKLQAENIAQQLTETITKQFDDWLKKFGLMGVLDDVFYGQYLPPPEFEYFKDKDAQIVISNTGMMVNNHTIWFCEDRRPTVEVLNEIQDQLKDAGWNVSENVTELKTGTNLYIRVSKGRERIYVFRKKAVDPETGRYTGNCPNDPPKAPDTPIVFHYKKYFTDDQYVAIRQHLLTSDADVETLIMFSGLFSSKQDKDALTAQLEEKKSLNFDAHLHLAQDYQRRKQTEKAKNTLLYARALAYTMKDHSPRQSEIKNLAKKLGDKKLADMQVGAEVFQQVGFIDANSLDEPYEVEKKLGEPVLFYHVRKDGTIRTNTYRVIKGGKWEYSVQSIEKQEGMSGLSQTGVGKTENWKATQSFGCVEYSVNVQIRKTPKGTFKYIANKI